jgi:zinc-ribbon domain
MLIECPECKRQVSDQAESCPHCGNPMKPSVSEAHGVTQTQKERRAPIFLGIAAIALILSLFTPRLLLFFPIMATLSCATIALFRKETAPAAAVLVLVLGVGILVLDNSGSVAPQLGTNSANLDAAEITQWNWRKDPSFGTKGTIRWNVEVHNKSSQNIQNVKVEFTTFGRDRKLIATTFTYVSAIPPGATRADASYADFYGTEESATIKIAGVTFAR